MVEERWPPISIGTKVITTKPNFEIDDWTTEALASRQWGEIGVVVNFHDSHGLSYEVMHLDGRIGHYDPSEFDVL